MKYGDTVLLKCGHEGKVIWVSSDGEKIGVRGVKRSCKTCGKKTSSSWSPNVYIVSLTNTEE